MYAVIRAGGKQYRVAPGDVLRVETQASENGVVQFGDVLAVSAGEGQVSRPQSGALVTGEVLGEGRGKKILVFHYKKKKQYKKLNGHRQAFTAVRITEIAFDGQTFSAPAPPNKQHKAKKAKATADSTGEPIVKPGQGSTADSDGEPIVKPSGQAKTGKPGKKKSAPKKSAAKKSTGKKKS